MRISDWSSDVCSSDLALYRGVLEDDLERRGHLFLARAAADVEEVRREFAVELDDVHRRHRQTGTIDHATDVAVELDVGEVIFRRLYLGREIGRASWRERVCQYV